MKIGRTGLIGLVIVALTGCISPQSNGILFGGTAADTKGYLDNYAHVLLVCVTSDRVADGDHPVRSELHFAGTVVRVYKGGWQVSDRIEWSHELDGKVSNEPNRHVGELFFVFTNQQTSKAIYLDTGDWPHWDRELARQIETALK